MYLRNYANGQVSMSVKGLTASNIIKNGNFANGTTDWIGNHATISVANNVCIVKGTGTYDTPVVTKSSSSKVYYEVGHIYYGKSTVKVTNDSCTLIRTRLASGYGDINITSPVTNKVYTQSRLFKIRTSVSAQDSISHRYVDATSSDSKELEVSNFMCIDVTAIFGAGNEPTLEQCDKMFANYFEGTKSTISDCLY